MDKVYCLRCANLRQGLCFAETGNLPDLCAVGEISGDEVVWLNPKIKNANNDCPDFQEKDNE